MQLAEWYNATFSKQQRNSEIKQKGAIQKTKVPKMVNRIRAFPVVLLLVQTTSRSPNFLENVPFDRNWDTKLQISGRKPA